jgi:hypothetical protein
MVFGTSRRRAKLEGIEAAAEALIRDLGDDAYREALSREHEAGSDALARDWADVARAVARKTGSRFGFDLSTQLAMNTFFVLDREPGQARKSQLRESEPGHQSDQKVPSPQPFRVQFIGGTPDSGPSILREVEIRASDVSAAIIAASMAAWPPKTIELQILDRDGQKVFERQKSARQKGIEARRADAGEAD